jgi:hypothetical protein
MSVVPHSVDDAESAPDETATPSPSVPDLANSASPPPKDTTASAVAANREAWAKAAALRNEATRSDVARRIAGIAEKASSGTKQATASAVAAGRTGFAKAAKLGRETVLPELGRTGAKVAERTRPDRLAQDYRRFLKWLHGKVLDELMIEPLFFVPTKDRVSLETLTVRGGNRASGHDYRPSPYFVFKWALAAVEDDLSLLNFVDYGAGKGRVLLLAAQHPFAAVGGIEFAEELHDNATMNIAQFSRSRMKCRNVECVIEDVTKIGVPDGETVYYFFNPFAREIFAEVLQGIVASYHARPRRLYVILIDMDAAELMHKTGVFQEAKLPPAQRLLAKLLSPYTITVYRSLA